MVYATHNGGRRLSAGNAMSTLVRGTAGWTTETNGNNRATALDPTKRKSGLRPVHWVTRMANGPTAIENPTRGSGLTRNTPDGVSVLAGTVPTFQAKCGRANRYDGNSGGNRKSGIGSATTTVQWTYTSATY